MTKFWAKKTGNFWLSNFYPAVIEFKGKKYPTSEHLYQALKCDYEKEHEEVRISKSPKEAKTLARTFSNKKPLQERINFMRTAIRMKFDQHIDIRKKLLETQGLIVEDSPYDELWGVGSGEGVNLMGILLMELRETYVTENSFEEVFG